MLMKVIHSAQRTIRYEHVHSNSPYLGAWLADDNLRFAMGKYFGKSLRGTKRHHFFLGTANSYGYCVMKQHDHDRVACLESGSGEQERQRSPRGVGSTPCRTDGEMHQRITA